MAAIKKIPINKFFFFILSKFSMIDNFVPKKLIQSYRKRKEITQ